MDGITIGKISGKFESRFSSGEVSRSLFQEGSLPGGTTTNCRIVYSKKRSYER